MGDELPEGQLSSVETFGARVRVNDAGRNPQRDVGKV